MGVYSYTVSVRGSAVWTINVKYREAYQLSKLK